MSLLITSSGVIPCDSDIPYLSKAQHVAELIRRALKERAWQGQLPGENRLADEFKVSRPTVRRALDILTADGVLLPAAAGMRRKVCPSFSERVTRKAIRVGILTSRPLGGLPSSAQSGYRDLQKQLQAKGCEVTFATSSAWGTDKPGKLLRKLIDQYPMKAWVISNPTQAMEQWLMKENLLCICIGGTYRHSLPRIGSDGNGSVRSATRELISLGHHEIFYPVHNQFGVQMIEPFLEEMESLGSTFRNPRYTPLWAGHSVEYIALLERLFKGRRKPTAFVTLGLANLLSLITWLGASGLVVPRDVSIIHLLSDPTLDLLYPAITHYADNPSKLVREAVKMVMQLLETGRPFDREIMIPMHRIEGRSVAPPPST